MKNTTGAACAGARSSAYLPLPLSLALADAPLAFALAAALAFVAPFVAGLVSNARHNRQLSKEERAAKARARGGHTAVGW